MTPSAVEVSVASGGEVTVTFIGEHDLATRAETDELLGRLVAEHQLVTIDLSEATFIDSSFLHSMVKAHRAASGRGTRVRVRFSGARGIEQVLQASGLINVLAITGPELLTT